MSDLISRETAIDAVCAMVKECFGADDEEQTAIAVTIRNLPSAQPEERTEERTKTHACDLIDRREAIDELEHAAWGKEWDKALAKAMLESLPPAQPESAKRTAEEAQNVSDEDLISRKAAIDALDEIRHALWEIDIPSPTVPEYIEHHEQIQSVWKLLDKKQKELYVLPPAQLKSYRAGYQAGFKDAQPDSCKDAVSRSRVKLLLARLRDAVDDGYGYDYQSAVDELRDMPPAQTEIIRCRDCIYWHDITPANLKGYQYCHAFRDMMPKGGYCHKAQRREVNE